MAKVQEILRQHPYQIFHSSDGRWGTYLPDKDKKRRLVKRKERSDVVNAIVEFYTNDELSFLDVYFKWRSYHDQMVSDASAQKYDSDEKRYFENQKFPRMEISKITRDDVEVFIKESIDSNKLCQSAAKTLYHYLDNTFNFGIRHGYILKSPMRYMQAKDFYKYTYESERSKKPKLISTDKLGMLQDRYESDLLERPDSIPIYAVIFSSLTGMRVGEIAALRWDCVYDDYILVDKSQKYNPKTRQYYISSTKNSKIRQFPLTDEIRSLLERVKLTESELGWLTDYIFSDANGPISFRKISSCLKNKCRQIGLDTVGIHAYRRTVNSMMALNGVPANVRATLLGHSKEVNEKYYTFDASSMDDKIEIMSKVNTQMNGR